MKKLLLLFTIAADTGCKKDLNKEQDQTYKFNCECTENLGKPSTYEETLVYLNKNEILDTVTYKKINK